VETQLIRISATQMLPSTNIPQHSDALKYHSCTKQAGEVKMPRLTSHRAEHQRSKGYTSHCFGVFGFPLISKFCTARNSFMSPESSSSQFFLKAASFSCCLQLLTPITCSWMCRKSKGTAAVGVKVNLYTAKLERLLNSD